MKYKLDPNHKKKCKILMEVCKGKMSVSDALERMEELDLGMEEIPPVVQRKVIDIREDQIPF